MIEEQENFRAIIIFGDQSYLLRGFAGIRTDNDLLNFSFRHNNMPLLLVHLLGRGLAILPFMSRIQHTKNSEILLDKCIFSDEHFNMTRLLSFHEHGSVRFCIDVDQTNAERVSYNGTGNVYLKTLPNLSSVTEFDERLSQVGRSTLGSFLNFTNSYGDISFQTDDKYSRYSRITTCYGSKSSYNYFNLFRILSFSDVFVDTSRFQMSVATKYVTRLL